MEIQTSRRFLPIAGRLLIVLLLASPLLVPADPRAAPDRWSGKNEPVAHAGRTLYVDTGGGDTTGNGSSGNPWKTIQKAAEEVLAGDLVLINPGTYLGPITIETGGTSAAPIVFRANGSGVIVQGSGSDRDAIFVTYADWVTIDGFRVQEATRAGIRIDNANYVTVKNSVLADNGTWGVFTDFSDNLLLEYNEAYGSVREQGIYVSNSAATVQRSAATSSTTTATTDST